MSLSNTGIDRFLQQNYYSKTQLNAGQLDSRYYAESEFLATSAGAGDAGKPVKLNGSGALDATLYASSVVTLTGTQTLTNKTLTAPVISTIVNTGTLTLPTSTDTLVGRATTDTLTNKTLTSPNFGLSNWTIGTLTTNPLINWDSNDYVTYDRIANQLNFVVSSTTVIGVTASGLAVTGALSASTTFSAATSATTPTLYGGSAANADLTIEGTSSATKASSYVILQPSGGNTVVGGLTTDHRFEVQDAGASNYRITMNLNVSGVNYLNSYSAAPGTLTAAPLTLVSSALGTTGDTFRIETTKTPTGAGAGSAGQIAWDTGFLYICTASNVWKRVALSAF